MSDACCKHGDVEDSLRESLRDCLGKLSLACDALLKIKGEAVIYHNDEFYGPQGNHSGLERCFCSTARIYGEACYALNNIR